MHDQGSGTAPYVQTCPQAAMLLQSAPYVPQGSIDQVPFLVHPLALIQVVFFQVDKALGKLVEVLLTHPRTLATTLIPFVIFWLGSSAPIHEVLSLKLLPKNPSPTYHSRSSWVNFDGSELWRCIIEVVPPWFLNLPSTVMIIWGPFLLIFPLLFSPSRWRCWRLTWSPPRRCLRATRWIPNITCSSTSPITLDRERVTDRRLLLDLSPFVPLSFVSFSTNSVNFVTWFCRAATSLLDPAADDVKSTVGTIRLEVYSGILPATCWILLQMGFNISFTSSNALSLNHPHSLHPPPQCIVNQPRPLSRASQWTKVNLIPKCCRMMASDVASPTERWRPLLQNTSMIMFGHWMTCCTSHMRLSTNRLCFMSPAMIAGCLPTWDL